MWLSPHHHTRSELSVFLSQCSRLLWILRNKVKHQVRFIESIYFWELKGRWRKTAMTFIGLELNSDSIKACCLLNDGCCCSEREMLDRFNYSQPRLSIYLETESNSLFVAGCLRINHVTPWNRCPIGVTVRCDMFGLSDVQCQRALLGNGHSQSVLHEGRTVLSQMADAEEAAQQNPFLYHIKSIPSKN